MNASISDLVVDHKSNLTGLEIADLSSIPRFGVKGVGAEVWLATQSIAVPDRPNSWAFLSKGGIIARLGINEFVIEDRTISPQLIKACKSPPARVYPVLRQDLAIALMGTKVNELLLQTCNFNFQSLSITENPVILTSMAGVNVTVIPGVLQEQLFYRIWCDRTFGTYLWETLNAIAFELDGSAIALETFTKKDNN
jgi:sarcosine oxidase, subunit gamma